MKKYTVYIPLIATASVEVFAEDKKDAFFIAKEMVNDNEVDLMGFDPESYDQWWVEEE